MLAKTTWGAGDYPLMATVLEPVSAQVVAAAEVGVGDRVIDVATGTGNAALQAAARGASVLAVDFEPALLALARDRERSAGVIEWVEGEAECLPAADGHADVLVSVFGVMYALDHSRAAQELVRVLAPCGRIALAAWTPGSFLPAMGAVVAQYLPPPPAASGPPSRWGDAEFLRLLLHQVGARLKATGIDRLTVRFDDIEEAAGFLIRTAGHVTDQKQQLSRTGRWQALNRDLEAFIRERCGPTPELELEYLIATATRD